MENRVVATQLDNNINFIKGKLGGSGDVMYREFTIPMFGDKNALAVYIDGLVGAKEIDDILLRPLMSRKNENINPQENNALDQLISKGIISKSVTTSKDFEKLLDGLLAGDTIVFIDTIDQGMIISTRGFQMRSIAEPSNEASIRGAKDSFIESIRANTALIRRRIRDYDLRFDSLKIGKRTKTDIALAYIDSIVNKDVLKELNDRLNRIDIDAVLDSAYIEEMIEDSSFSLFPQIEVTERPDKACASILEGKIIIIVDNSPFVLILPVVFWQFFQASDDYYERFQIATFLRWLRVFALIMSMTLSSIYVMLVSFHQEMLPTPLALNIASSREGVPFPSILEALFMEFMFELMREAGLRMPKPIGQAVGIVGALVIGEAAVNAGLVGPLLVIMVAGSAISSFAIPAYSASYSLRLTRFLILICTGIFGILGFLGSGIFITLHLLSLRSFGVQFLGTLDPVVSRGRRDMLFKAPLWAMKKRSSVYGAKESYRQSAEGNKPEKPKS
ncbi:spore germination protein KA [Clostridium zeae]|uniref:Spore germination protein KA n=1 Tax=Clostridium zeae TaxID=2759022 RepID=A0ABQ1EBX0_9CLOT|nr:spore germination protein [Clostridium zeae]GFZ31998.1 spore germination protein KA [Clostridium zeae]